MNDLREELEAAFDTAEETTDEVETEETETEEEEVDETEDSDEQDVDEEESDDEEDDESDDEESDDDDSDEEDDSEEDDGGEGDSDEGDSDDSGDTGRAPVSWTPEAREEWAKIPPAARAEIERREAEVQNALASTTAARNFSDSWQEMLRPYEPLMAAQGANAFQGVQRLLQIGAGLSMGSSAEKASIITSLVKQYEIDIETLDKTLAGHMSPENDTASVVRNEVQKALAPFTQSQQAAARSQQEALNTEVQAELQAFASDPANEFYNDVRTTMGTIFEIAGREGRAVSLKDAYDQAVSMDTRIQGILQQRNKARTASERKAAAAKKKRAASVKRRRQRAASEGPREAAEGMEMSAAIQDAWDSVESGGRRRV